MEYKKQSGSAEAGGQFYEIKLAMFFLLRSIAARKKGAIDHFYLAANLEAAHPFDDIVLKYTSGGSSRIILLQAKFKKKDAVTWTKLMSPSNKGDFCTRFYLDGHLGINLADEEILQGLYEGRELILYTNARLDCKNKSLVGSETNEILHVNDEEMVKLSFNSEVYDMLKTPTDFSNLVDELIQCVKTSEYKPEIPIFRAYRNHLQESVIGFEAEKSTGGRLFAANFLSGSEHMTQEIQDLRRALFDKLKSKQENNSQLESRLSAVQVRIAKGHAGTKSVEPKLKLKTQLNEDEVRGFLDDFRIATGQPGEEELENLMKDEISLVYDVDKIDSNTIYSEVYSRMQRWWKDSNLYLTEDDDWFEKSKVDLSRRVFIAFIDSARNEYCNTSLVYRSVDLELFHDNHRLINIESSDATHFLNCVQVCQILETIKTKYIILSHQSVSDKLEEVLDAFDNDYDVMVIVGDECIPMDLIRIMKRKNHKRLVSIGKAVKCKEIPTNNLSLQVGFNNLTVDSQDLILNKSQIRLFGCNVILGDLFKPELRHLISDEILAQVETKQMPEIGQPLCNLDDMESYNIPRKLSRKSKNKTMTNKKPEELRPDDGSKFIVISAEPGMGKSHLLSSLPANSFMWKYRINLASKFNILEKKDISVLPFLRDACEMTETEFALFKNYYESLGGVVLLFDGFDEIDPDNKDLVLGLFKELTSSKVDQIWVTTRPCFKQELENELNTVCYNLEPFSKGDQKKFLKFVWNELDDSQVEHFLDEFSRAIKDPNGVFISNPLHLKMAAELRDELSSNRKLNLLTVYEKFFVKKYYQKLVVSNSIMKNIFDKMYVSVKLEHEKLAMFALFDINELSVLFSLEDINAIKAKMKDIKDGSEKSEVVQSIVENKPIFVHRTFSEYFAAIWLANNQKAGIGDFLMNVGFFDRSNITLRRFFDMAVANDVTRAVLEDDEPALEDVSSSTIDVSDEGGRTALHLASSYGNLVMIQMLLKKGASLSSVDRILEWTPIMFAHMCRQWRVIADLIASGDKWNPIFAAPCDRDFFSKSELMFGDEMHDILIAGDVHQMSYANRNKLSIFQFGNTKDWTSLHNAAARNSDVNTRKLLKKGAKVNVKNKHGVTPLHMAVVNGSRAVAEILMENRANVDIWSEHGLTPLHLASYYGHYDLAEQLIERGADVLAKDATKESALHLAVERDNYDVACLLIDSGADLNAKNKNGLTPLHLAAAFGHLSIAKKLMARGARIEDKDAHGKTALHLAAMHGSVGVVNHLIYNQADVNARDKHDFTPLHAICRLHYGSSVKLLIEAGAEVNAKAYLGRTPLLMAARFGNFKMAKFLIDNGGDPNAESNHPLTPLALALFYGYDQIVNLLLDNGANVNCKTRSGITPLITAAEKGNIDMVKCLVAKGVDLNAIATNKIHLDEMQKVLKKIFNSENETINTKNDIFARDEEEEFTALFLAIRNDHNGVVEVLIDSGVDLNLKYIKDLTALHLAVIKGNINLVKQLLSKGCDVNVKGWYDMTPLHVAIECEKDEIAIYLIENGSDLNIKTKDGYTPLHTAAKKGRVDIIKYLITLNDDLDKKTTEGITPLHIAVFQGNIEVVMLLLDGGADIHSENRTGYTALHIAAEKGHLDIAKYLIANGSDPWAKNNDDLTPFHKAVSMGQNEVAIEMIKSKSGVQYKDKNGMTALHVAVLLGNLTIVKYLIESGSDLDADEKGVSTPLQLAIFLEHENISIELIDGGCKINLKNEDGFTALHMAVGKGSMKIVKYLVEKGCNLNDTFDITTSLLASVLKEYDDVTKEFIQSGYDIVHMNGFTALHMAASNGNLNIVKCLTANGCHLNVKSSENLTPLHVAVCGGHHEIIVHLVKQGADLTSKDKQGYTALHWAIERGHVKIAKYLIEKGSNLGLKTNTGMAPLHLAVNHGLDEIVIYLLRKGCDIDERDEDDYTPLHWAANKASIARILIENGSNVNLKTNDGMTPLALAISFKNDNVAMELIKGGSNFELKDKYGYTALHRCAYYGQINILKYLIANKCNFNEITNNCRTALHIAIVKEEDLVAIELIESGCDVDLREIDGFTALHSAVIKGNEKIVHCLLKKGSGLDIEANNGMTPLLSAIDMGREEIAMQLISSGCNVNCKDPNGFTALHLALRNDNVKVAKHLISHGSDINAKTNNSITPLHLAIIQGHDSIAINMVDRGCDINSMDEVGFTPLHWAAMKGNVNIAKYLFARMSDRNVKSVHGMTPLHMAVMYERQEIAKEFIDCGSDVNCRNDDLSTPLHMAAEQGNMAIVERLMRVCDLDARDKHDRTPLHVAISKDHEDVALKLIDSSNIHSWDFRGFAALHHAAQTGNSNIAYRLIQKGSDPNDEAYLGVTPLHLAILGGHESVVELLVESGSSVDARAGIMTPYNLAVLRRNGNILRFLIAKGCDRT